MTCCASAILWRTPATSDMVFPELAQFMTAWLTLVQHHGGAKRIWKDMIGTAMVGFSTIRWWSKAEVQNEIAVNFGQLLSFLRRLDTEGIGDATAKKMLEIYHAGPLWLELSFAASLDGGERLVQLGWCAPPARWRATASRFCC